MRMLKVTTFLICALSLHANAATVCESNLITQETVVNLKAEIDNAKPGAIVDSLNVSLETILSFDDRKIEKVGMEISQAKLTEPLGQTYRKLGGVEAEMRLTSSLSDAGRRTLAFLSASELEEHKLTLVGALAKGHLLEILVAGRPAGILLVRSFQFKDQEKLLVSWIWRDRVAAERGEFLSAVKSSLRALSEGKDVVASIHLRNSASLKFFKDMGFEPICVFISK